jgi:hypothetical protein
MNMITISCSGFALLFNGVQLVLFSLSARVSYLWIDEWIDDWIDNFHNVYLFHCYVFSTLGQQWLASTPCTWRGSLRPLREVFFSLEPHRSSSLAYAGGGNLQPLPHHSSSLLWLRRLSGDVGGGSSSSSDTSLGVSPPPGGELILNTRSRF